MVGEDEAAAIGAAHLLPADGRIRAVSPDDDSALERAFCAAVAFVFKMNAGQTVSVARDLLESAGEPGRARSLRARAEPFVELAPVHHADEAAFDRHVDGLASWRNHCRKIDAGFEEMARNCEIPDQAGRDCAAAGLDSPRSVDEGDLATATREIVGGSRSRRASADHDDIENLFRAHRACAFQGRAGNAPCALITVSTS